MPKQRQFTGFHSPNYTQVPDELFDELMPDLSGAELKVLLYVVRRTFGFKRESDNIALSQMLNGITRRDGTVLDRGVGLSKPTLLQALRSLTEQNIIIAERRQSEEKGNEPTSYRLNVMGGPGDTREEEGGKETQPPLVKKFDQGVGHKTLPSPWSKNLTTQQRAQQETVQQHVVVVAGKAGRSGAQSVAAEPSTAANTASPENTDATTKALIGFGISPKVAQSLALNFPEEHILAKLEIAAYLVEKGSRLVAHNPAGYLRRAIEEDWSPPKGYKTQREREAKQVADRALIESIEQQEEERRREEAKAVEALKQAREDRLERQADEVITGSTMTTKTAWIAALERIRSKVSVMNFNVFFRDAVLVSVNGGQGMIALSNRWLLDEVQKRFTSVIKATLQEVLRSEIDVRYVVVPFPEVETDNGAGKPEVNAGEEPGTDRSGRDPVKRGGKSSTSKGKAGTSGRVSRRSATATGSI